MGLFIHFGKDYAPFMKYETLLAAIAFEFPSFKIVRKEASPLMRFVDLFLRICSMGKQSAFMTSDRKSVV